MLKMVICILLWWQYDKRSITLTVQVAVLSAYFGWNFDFHGGGDDDDDNGDDDSDDDGDDNYAKAGEGPPSEEINLNWL